MVLLLLGLSLKLLFPPEVCVHEIERLRKFTKTEAPEHEPEREMNLKVGDLPLDDVSPSLGAAAQLQPCP